MKVSQLCLTLRDPMDSSSPSSSVMGFPRQECWSGLLFPFPGDLPNPCTERRSPTLHQILPSEPPVKQSTSCMPCISWKMLGWMTHKLESTLLVEIATTPDMQWTSTLMAKSKEELKMGVKEESENAALKCFTLLMRVKDESENAALKLSI